MVNLLNIEPNIVTASLSDKIWLFYGEMATRKTSVACKFPKHILFAYDIGYKLINGAMAVPMQTWSDLKSAIKQLDKPEIKEKFDVVIIDTIGMAYQACYQYMLTQMGVDDPGQYGAWGMGWKKIRNEFEITIRSIVQKGYGLIMLAHSDEVEKEDKVTKKKVLGVKIDIDKRPDLIIKSLADFVFFLHKENKDGTNESTVYAYSNLVDIDTKSRSKYFSPKFEFTFENLQRELEKAIKIQYEEEKLEYPSNIDSVNPYQAPKVNFEELRKNTQELALELINLGLDKEVGEILMNIFKGVPLKDIIETEDNLNKLTVAYTSLQDFKK